MKLLSSLFLHLTAWTQLILNSKIFFIQFLYIQCFNVPDKNEWMVCKHARRQKERGKTHTASGCYSSIGWSPGTYSLSSVTRRDHITIGVVTSLGPDMSARWQPTTGKIYCSHLLHIIQSQHIVMSHKSYHNCIVWCGMISHQSLIGQCKKEITFYHWTWIKVKRARSFLKLIEWDNIKV